MIERVERFVTNGKEFKTMDEAVTHRENLVEEFLRKLPGFYDITSKNRQNFVLKILELRHQFRKLLDFDYSIEEREGT